MFKLGWLGRASMILALTGVLAALPGCTRPWYRRTADAEVYDILAEKDKYAEWKIEQFHVYPDARARFADPSNPDCPPMPPDDEATWKLTPHPQQPGLQGVAHFQNTSFLNILQTWDEQNRAERKVAADAAKAPTGQPGVYDQAADAASRSGPIQTLIDTPPSSIQGYMLTLDQAVELGLINSREYQSFREDLYLAALPVTLQRFSFAWQWAASLDAVRQWATLNSTQGYQNNWNLASGASVGKLFSTGALLTASFANTTVFNFVSHGLSSYSLINVDFVQPLLQGGGKAVTLEPLTQAERNLVYSIRSYARFREQFYSSIALGSGLPGSLAGAVGGGGAGATISPLAALGIASTNVSGSFRGYYPALNRQLKLAVDVSYLTELEKALKLFEAFQVSGQVAPLQVDQIRSTLLQQQNTVLQDKQDWTNALDQFKFQLGLPSNLPLILDDSLGRPITRQLDRYYELLNQADEAYKLIEKQDALPPDKLRPMLLDIFTRNQLVIGTTFQQRLPKTWEAWAKATDKEVQGRLEQLRIERNKLLDLKTDLEIRGETMPAEQAKALTDSEFELDVGGLEQVLRRYESRPWEKAKTPEDQAKQKVTLFRVVAYAAQLVVVGARNDRFAQVRQMWPVLPAVPLGDVDLLTADIDLAQEVAVQAALTNRWDLMNARAQVNDAWRQLAVTANGLLGVLNVGYHMDAQTEPGGTKAITFVGTNQLLSINAQLPLVRKEEQIVYRIALINYGRAQRNLMSLEDSIAAQVRFDVRQLQLFAENFKIQQRVLELSYSLVENSLAVIVAPVDPDQLRASGTAGQANAAALTNQYLGNLAQLNSNQSRMYGNWLSYLATRTQLYLNMERLPLDSRGVWIDEQGINPQLSVPRPFGGGPPFQQPEPQGQRGPIELGVTPGLLPAGISGAPAVQRGQPGSDPVRPVRLLPPSAPQGMGQR